MHWKTLGNVALVGGLLAALSLVAVGLMGARPGIAQSPFTQRVPMVAKDGIPGETPSPITTATPSPSPSPTGSPSPSPSASVSPSVSATASPSPTEPSDECANAICTTATSMYTDGDGAVHVVGLVLNNSATTHQIVEVEAVFLNGTGNEIAEGTGIAFVLTIVPGTDSPFEVVLENPPAGIVGFETGIGDTQSIPFLFPFQMTETVTDFSGSHVSGTVRNDSAGMYSEVVVTVAVFDGSGNVLRIAHDGTSPEDLAAGATGSFDVSLGSVVPGVATARAWASAELI